MYIGVMGSHNDKNAAVSIANRSGKKDVSAQESLGPTIVGDHGCYFRNGESNPGLQGENLLS